MKWIADPGRRSPLAEAWTAFRATRFLPVVAMFLAAFAVDRLTNQHYSSVWGTLAIGASIFTLFPAVRSALAAFAAYAAVWTGFNLARAVADDAGIGLADARMIARWEAEAFGGRLPSALLQDWLLAADPRLFDVAMAGVYTSFFVTPTAIAGVLWLKRRDEFHRYLTAIACCFGLGLIGFFLLPTAPPWLSEPGRVQRVVPGLLAGRGLGDGTTAAGNTRLWFEPNDLAAVPSVHVAMTVLIFLVARRFGATQGVLGAGYALAMTIAVVYLGEHFVLDAALGWLAAVVSWVLVTRRQPPPAPG